MNHENKKNPLKIVIYGAGSVGCYIGACLMHEGHHVQFIGRESMASKVKQHGLKISDLTGKIAKIDECSFSTPEHIISDADVTFVTVKSHDCLNAAENLRKRMNENAVIVTLQNGIRASEIIRQTMPDYCVLAGIVAFNIVRKADGHFHRSTDGNMILETHPISEILSNSSDRAGLAIATNDNIQAVQWTKLIMNLNNAINALSGLPLRQQLHEPHYRYVMVQTIREALAVLRAADIRTQRIGKIVPALLPTILSLPTWLFRRVASAMLTMDADARSSMYDDLVNHRLTEIDFINGEITRLGQHTGVSTPINDHIVTLINTAQEKKMGSPMLSPAQLLPTH